MKSLMVAGFVLMLLLVSQAGGQTLPSQTSKEEDEKARAELERKTLILLDDVVSDAQALKLPDNRAIVLASAADLLWTRDEKRARVLFRDGLTALGEALARGAGKDAEQFSDYWMLLQLRQQLLRMVAGRDPQLALDLQAVTRPPALDEAGLGAEARKQEVALEQALAVEAAAKDPKRAFQMAEDSLSKGVSYGLISTVHSLQQKDGELAQRLLTDIVKKLQSDNSSRDPMTSFIALDLLRAALRTPEQAAAMKAKGAAPPKPLVFDEQMKRDLADVVARAAMSPTGENMSITLSLRSFMPDLERLVPERAEQLRKRINDAEKMLDPEAKKWMEFESLMREGSTDTVLEAAQKAPSGMRAALYGAAASKLFEAGETERARQIISENLSGREREQMLAEMDRRLVLRALEQGKLDEAKKLIARVQSNQGRALQFSLLATALMKKGERKSALELMEEARKLVNPQPDNQEEINTLLVVARAFALIDPPRAFELIEPVVDQANEMVSAAALLDKFGTNQGRLFRRGEMVLNTGFLTASGMFTQYGRELGALARADFARTKAVADRFQRGEVKLMAHLLIAQSVLSDRLTANNEGDASLGFNLSFGTGAFVVNDLR